MKKLLLLFLLVSAYAHADTAFPQKLALAAEGLTKQQVRYDPAYYSIRYPMGDVPANVGVCTDVVVRAYRVVGVDLQRLIHEDMSDNFSFYPSQKLWGLKKPDRNIDHRRVQNLQAFFTRHGKSLGPLSDINTFQPGDIVTWVLPGNLAHIGVVSSKRDPHSDLPLIVHNMGAGQVLEDMLLAYPITGHYRYLN